MAYLILEDLTYFKAEEFGAPLYAPIYGEIVFNTGMTGYQEVLTDPSYFGQIVVMTYPLIGNYGTNEQDSESGTVHARAIIAHEFCSTPSNWHSTQSLENFMKQAGITGLQHIDTRALTKIIRKFGTMAAKIQREAPTEADFESLKGFEIKNHVREVTCRQKYIIKAENCKYNIAVFDLGIRRGMLNSLLELGCNVTVFPSFTASKEILVGNFDGLLVSSGPGNPKDNIVTIKNVKDLMGKLPVMGICLGHQLMALAQGGNTRKLEYGHRGGNHPVKDLASGRVYITSHNHGYTVVQGSVKNGVETYISLNDGTNEGLSYPELGAFSVQFHPEASPGPNDTKFIFSEFLKLLER